MYPASNMQKGGEKKKKSSSVLPEKRGERASAPRTQKIATVVAWEGAVPSDVVLKIQIFSLGSRLGKDRASKFKASSDEYNPFPVCAMQQMTHRMVCVCA